MKYCNKLKNKEKLIIVHELFIFFYVCVHVFDKKFSDRKCILVGNLNWSIFNFTVISLKVIMYCFKIKTYFFKVFGCFILWVLTYTYLVFL